MSFITDALGITNTKATRQAGQAANAQADISKQYAGNMENLFHQAQPFYGSSLQGLAQNAGISPQGTLLPLNEQPWYRQAAEDAGKAFTNSANQVKYQFNQEGVGGSPLGSALVNLARGQQQDLGNFYRIQAPEVQNERIGQLMGALSPGLTASPGAAIQGLGQASNQLFQQGSLQNSLLGQALQAYGMYSGMGLGGGGNGGYNSFAQGGYQMPTGLGGGLGGYPGSIY